MATIKFRRTTTSTTPTGLTFGEPAFVQGINSFYVTNSSGTSVRVGAEVDTNTSLGSSDNKIPTQLAVKTYVDNNLASGAVTGVNGVTGAVTFRGGGTYGVTFTIDLANKNIWVSNIGVTSAAAGSGISVSGATGTVTISNTGVTGIAGTANQITVSGTTGSVTISLPSAITTPGSLTVTGNLVVNGTTTTVNSTTLSVEDPLIQLAKGNSAADSLDIGIYGLFDTAGTDKYTGLFRDASDGKWRLFTGLEEAPTTTVNIAGTGYAGATLVANLEGNASTATTATSATTATNATNVATTVDASDTNAFLAFVNLASDTNQAVRYSSGLTYSATANSLTATTFVGSLSGNATTATTATNATNVAMLSDTADTNAFLAFVNDASNTNQAMKYNSGLTYNASANSLTATTFVGSLSGNATTATSATTATNATNVATTVDSSDTNAFLTFVNLASDTNQAVRYSSGLTYNASANSLTATTFVGSLSGNATSATSATTATTATNATNATNVIATEQTSGSSVMYLVGIGAAGTTGGLFVDATAQAGLAALSYTPVSGTLTAYQVEAIVDGGTY